MLLYARFRCKTFAEDHFFRWSINDTDMDRHLFDLPEKIADARHRMSP